MILTSYNKIIYVPDPSVIQIEASWRGMHASPSRYEKTDIIISAGNFSMKCTAKGRVTTEELVSLLKDMLAYNDDDLYSGTDLENHLKWIRSN